MSPGLAGVFGTTVRHATNRILQLIGLFCKNRHVDQRGFMGWESFVKIMYIDKKIAINYPK